MPARSCLTGLLAGTFAALVAGAASAGSIERVPARAAGDSPSIRAIACPGCTDAPAAGPGSYVVPDIAPGTQSVEIRTVNGQQELVRREAWQGGSPVTFISRLESNVVAAIADDRSKTAVGPAELDKAATGALDAAPAPQPLDLDQLQLRLE